MPLIPLFIGESGTSLVAQDATLTSAFDNVVLTQDHSLVVADASLSEVFDNVVLTQIHILIIQDSNIPSVFDNVVLQVPAILAVQDWTIGGEPVATPLSNIIILPDGKIGFYVGGKNYIEV